MPRIKYDDGMQLPEKMAILGEVLLTLGISLWCLEGVGTMTAAGVGLLVTGGLCILIHTFIKSVD